MRVAVIGSGAFGTALAAQIARNGHEVLIWSYEAHVAQEINGLHRNNTFLPDVALPKEVEATASLEEALKSGEVIFNATPVFATRSTYSGKNLDGKLLISASKGIEKGTHKLLHEIFSEVLAGDYTYAALSGPSFAAEVAGGFDTAVTISSNDRRALLLGKKLLKSKNFKVEVSGDVVGVELAGALKNVLAIAAGVAAGAGMGKNYQAAVFVRGLDEMIALGERLGAKRETFYSLAGLGDLFLTSTSDQSRNFTFGFSLGKGEAVDKAKGDNTVEGVGSAESAYFLSQKFKLKTSLFKNIYQIIFAAKPAAKGLIDIWDDI